MVWMYAIGGSEYGLREVSCLYEGKEGKGRIVQYCIKDVKSESALVMRVMFNRNITYFKINEYFILILLLFIVFFMYV